MTDNIQTTKIIFEEKHVNWSNETTTLYFNASKEILAEEFPEADATTISVEFPNTYCEARFSHVEITPAKEGCDYDWQDFELPRSMIEQLFDLAKDAERLDQLDEIRNRCEEMFNQTGGFEECDDWDECIVAVDKTADQIRATYRKNANVLFPLLLEENKRRIAAMRPIFTF